MRKGIFIGSFDPVHKGHIKIVKTCLRKKLVDEVLIIPTGNYWDKQNLSPLEKRIKMLSYYENKKIKIDKVHNEIQFTSDLFKQLSQENPKDELILILGADNIPKFNQWHNYEELLLYKFIVVKRAENGLKSIRKMMRQLNKENYEILKMPKFNASSTYIRKNMNYFRKVRKMIGKKVYNEYIR